MKIAIVGAGGVGGYFGARLAESGCDVFFIARGAHLEAMRKDGLKIRSPLGDLDLKSVQATSDPAAIGLADVVLVAVKLWDTETAARSLKPLVGPDTAVISLQNGVEKDAVLARYITERNLLGGVCYIAASIAAPGVIEHANKLAKITFGEMDGRPTPRSLAFLEKLGSAQISADLSGDIRREIWEKFVFLVGLSATTALLRLPIGVIREDPVTRRLLLDTMQETVSVGIAKDVQLAQDYAVNRLEFCDILPAAMTSSLHVDLARGNRLEIDWLSGAVMRYGRELGIPTPVNNVTYAALKLYRDGHSGPEAAAEAAR
jgi:2-dehydropantoate 2-reductase